MKKREFLKKFGILAAGGFTASAINTNAMTTSLDKRKSKKKVGLQLYSLREEFKNDIPGGFQKIKEIGYSYVEAPGYNNGKIYNYQISEFKQLANDAGVCITGAHVNPSIRKYTTSNRSEVLDFWRNVVEDYHRLGVDTIVQPGMPIIENHYDADLVCEIFNKAGAIAKSAGIRWGYHNHSDEFRRVARNVANNESQDNPNSPGDVIYDLLINGTEPDLVFFELDVYWTVMGQNDPLEYFAKYAGRFPVLHIKDRKILGQSGMLNFENIFTSAYKNGLDAFYVELESLGENEGSQFDGVSACFEYLNKQKFVQ